MVRNDQNIGLGTWAALVVLDFLPPQQLGPSYQFAIGPKPYPSEQRMPRESPHNQSPSPPIVQKYKRIFVINYFLPKQMTYELCVTSVFI